MEYIIIPPVVFVWLTEMASFLMCIFLIIGCLDGIEYGLILFFKPAYKVIKRYKEKKELKKC